jgi:hypothetical protein
MLVMKPVSRSCIESGRYLEECLGRVRCRIEVVMVLFKLLRVIVMQHLLSQPQQLMLTAEEDQENQLSVNLEVLAVIGLSVGDICQTLLDS